jgi:hypothetical protein|eukprot:COSAG06_NODE_134_length_22423_cov_17.315445_5_plen_91_part_00
MNGWGFVTTWAGTFVENVVWNCASSCFKGDHHNISRNTVMEVSTGGSTADGSKTPALYGAHPVPLPALSVFETGLSNDAVFRFPFVFKFR